MKDNSFESSLPLINNPYTDKAVHNQSFDKLNSWFQSGLNMDNSVFKKVNYHYRQRNPNEIGRQLSQPRASSIYNNNITFVPKIGLSRNEININTDIEDTYTIKQRMREERIKREREEMHRMMENNMFSKLGQSSQSKKQLNLSPPKKTSESPVGANKSELFIPSTSLGRPLLFHKQSRNEAVYNSFTSNPL